MLGSAGRRNRRRRRSRPGLADAAGRNPALDPATGEELQALAEETMRTPEEVIQRTRAVLGLE